MSVLSQVNNLLLCHVWVLFKKKFSINSEGRRLVYRADRNLDVNQTINQGPT